MAVLQSHTRHRRLFNTVSFRSVVVEVCVASRLPTARLNIRCIGDGVGNKTVAMTCRLFGLETAHGHIFVRSFLSKSKHKQQTTVRKPIECAPEAAAWWTRDWAEMAEPRNGGRIHNEVTRHRC